MRYLLLTPPSHCTLRAFILAFTFAFIPPSPHEALNTCIHVQFNILFLTLSLIYLGYMSYSFLSLCMSGLLSCAFSFSSNYLSCIGLAEILVEARRYLELRRGISMSATTTICMLGVSRSVICLPCPPTPALRRLLIAGTGTGRRLISVCT